MKPFTDQILKEIKMWTWIAILVPTSLLSVVLFVWVFGTQDSLHIMLVVSGTVCVLLFAIWVIWLVYSIQLLLNHWSDTKHNLIAMLDEVKTIHSIVKEVIRADNDK